MVKNVLVSFRVLCLVLALVVGGNVSLVRAAPPAQSSTVSLDAYRQLVNEAYAAAQRSDRIGLDASAETLLAITGVELPNEDIVEVDNAWLRDALAQEPPDFPLIVAALGAILDALAQARTPSDPDALQKLDQVFEVPPFKSREVPSAWNDFWDGVGRSIGRFFEQLFNQMPTPNINPPNVPNVPSTWGNLTPLGWVMLIIGGLLILALVLYTLRGVRRTVAAEARVRAEAEAEEEHMTVQEATDRTRNAAQAGDYRTATRYLYLSTLLWLEERGMVRYDRSRTNREYLQQLRGKPTHDAFVPVVDTFERVWYGKRPLESADFDAYQQQINALRSNEERRS